MYFNAKKLTEIYPRLVQVHEYESALYRLNCDCIETILVIATSFNSFQKYFTGDRIDE